MTDSIAYNDIMLLKQVAQYSNLKHLAKRLQSSYDSMIKYQKMIPTCNLDISLIETIKFIMNSNECQCHLGYYRPSELDSRMLPFKVWVTKFRWKRDCDHCSFPCRKYLKSRECFYKTCKDILHQSKPKRKSRK